MPKVAANDIAINYRIDGREGAPWITFSNSLATNLSMWDGQTAVLAEHYRVLRYDQRGHGASDAVPDLQRPRLARGEIFAAQYVNRQVVVAVVGLGGGGLLQDLIVTVALVAVAFQLGQQILQTMDTCGARCCGMRIGML